LGVENLLDKTPKGIKIMETNGDGRQNETIWEMSDDMSFIFIFVPFLLIAGLMSWLDVKTSRAKLSAWAKQHGLDLLEASHKFVFRGPFTLAANYHAVYRIRVRNKRGKEWTGYARVGGVFRLHVEVVFDH
jgi:hypothetical protein